MAASSLARTRRSAPTTSRDGRPGYRPYLTKVSAIRELGPHFVRVTFAGEDLQHFGTAGLDQRIKLFFPAPDGTVNDLGASDQRLLRSGDWYAHWRELPAGNRSPMRTYTIRAIRPELGEIDVDMVRHVSTGPAARWLETVREGQPLTIVGPDDRSLEYAGGIDWAPRGARHVLLAGDETAAPAICSILESLDDEVDAHAIIEVPVEADAMTVGDPHVQWLAREGTQRGLRLFDAVRRWSQDHLDEIAPAHAAVPQPLAEVDIDNELLWESPAVSAPTADSCGRNERCGGDFYAWFAGEAAMIKQLRRMMVRDVGLCRRRVSFMGYWRQGRAEAQ